MTFYVETEFLDSFLVHYKSFAAFEKTVMDRMWAHLLAMFTIAETKFVHIALVIWIIIVLDYLNIVYSEIFSLNPYIYYSVERLLKGLTILSETSLQIDCVFFRPQGRSHENWRDFCAIRVLSNTISMHGICIDPKNIS